MHSDPATAASRSEERKVAGIDRPLVRGHPAAQSPKRGSNGRAKKPFRRPDRGRPGPRGQQLWCGPPGARIFSGTLEVTSESGYTARVSNAPSLAALERLREGNRRFINNVRGIDALLSQHRRAELAMKQEPFAIVLGCSDSRSPAEILFDQGLGDLFVIRIAGNVVAPSQIASVEFAAQRFGIPLVVLMGHTKCGAIEATLEVIARPDDVSLRNLRSIVDRVRPAIEPLTQTDLVKDPEELRRQCVRANVRMGVNHLRHGSPALEQLVLEDKVAVVGAVYDLESGLVDFFEGVPES
jgi:carbonic anhydrase